MSKESLMKQQFKILHKDYCKKFNKFIKDIDKTFKEDSMTDEEFFQMTDWMKEYSKHLDYTMETLDDINSQIRNKTLELTEHRQKENKIFKKVTDTFMPMAIAYWMVLSTSTEEIN